MGHVYAMSTFKQRRLYPWSLDWVRWFTWFLEVVGYCDEAAS